MERLTRCLMIFCIFRASFAQEDPTASTLYGDLRGRARVTTVGAAFDEFIGVPYAKPPLGELRWNKPVAPTPWEGVRDARTFGKKCTQLGDLSTSEDCLYLNVYVPGSVSDLLSSGEQLPVLFYIHGGAFIYGSASNYDGGLLCTKGKVILVTTNYRVGTLGFLSTQSSAASGNYGLWDQIEALKWVNKNIRFFGGDASRLTVMGQSAGSASVSHLSLSPVAKGLFQRIILVSGSAASYFSATSHQRLTTSRLANHFGCPTHSDEVVVECLQKESSFSLDILGLVYPPLYDAYVCTQIPVIDGEVVPTKPIDAMKTGMNAEYDLLAGSAHHDGATFSLSFTVSVESVRFYLDFMFSAYQNKEEILSLVMDRYPNVLSKETDTRQKTLTKVVTDFIFGSRTRKEVELHYQTSSRNTFLYEFRHQFSSTNPEWLEGVHGEDLAFIFGRDYLEGDDLELSDLIMAYYCNFVYTGNPNEGPHSVSVEWPQYDTSQNIRLVESPQPYVESIPQDLEDDWTFWNHIYDIMIPRVDDDIFENRFDPKMLEMWNTLVREMQTSNGVED